MKNNEERERKKEKVMNNLFQSIFRLFVEHTESKRKKSEA